MKNAKPSDRPVVPHALRGPGRESTPVPSGIRPHLETATLEQLLALSLDLPIEKGAAGVARFALDRLQVLLADFALGICIADPNAGEQIVESRVPAGFAPATTHDPSRLFTSLACERVISLGNALTGSTFHIASDDPPRLDEHSTELLVALRVVSIIEIGVRRARAMEEAIQSSNELRRLQAQVIQAEKLASLGQIVAGVVHELNNPLTSIIAYSDYLKKRLETSLPPGDELERVRRIGDAAQRILRFSRDLVAYARPTSDIPGPVYLADVIEKAIVFCEHEFEKVSVSVQRCLDEDLPPVRGISGQLTQVFVNLFTNAAHAMNDGGGSLVVTASLGESPEWVRVEISDDGVGICEEHLDQVFEPFFTTKTEGRGTGLGLSIVRDIVTAHGGALVVTSEMGRGSSFELTLPAAARPPSSSPPEK